jgi:hypothetical protein
MNLYVTSAHIAMILAYTTMSLMNENFYLTLKSKSLARCNSSWFFFAGAMDLFMACMMWFIMDESEAPSVIVNENTNTVYQLLDVIRKRDDSEYGTS